MWYAFKSLTNKDIAIKFIRRPDLDTQTRINLVAQALACQGIYGARTALAKQYQISRSFLYQVIGISLLCLNELFATQRLESVPARFELDAFILLLRLEGQVPIARISEILRILGYPNDSTGMISQRLKFFGRCLSNTLNVDKPYLIFYLSDEIFALGRPILVTIDPVSTAILRIELAPNRTGDTWKKHFSALKDHQLISIGLGSDRGRGIINGFQGVYPCEIWCSDHFHEFRELTKLRVILEKQAYAAIAEEEEHLRILNNAKSEKNCQKRLQQYASARVDCNQKIARYQHVSDLLDLLFPSLYFFDLSTGQHRQACQVKSDVLTLMDLLDECELPKLQEQTQSIRSHIDDICVCYQQVEEICLELAKSLPEEALKFVGLAWQHEHQSHQHKGKQKKHHLAEHDFWLEVAMPLLGKQAEQKIEQAFELLNGMVRTSSLVEMVNSQIRPYLNSCKGQITQEHLNLIMFYFNHHQYKSGKRKGKAPIELLTGTKLEGDWLERLLETISQSQS